MGLAIVSVMACQVSGSVPATQMVEVTRIVRATQLVPAPTIEVTRLIPVAPVVEITSLVVQTVEVLVVVEATCVPPDTPPPEPPAPVAPAPTEAPPPTAAEAFPAANDSTLVWYDFEDYFQNGGSLADRSGNGYDAQMVGPVDVTEGISGGLAVFFKGDSYLEAPANPAAFQSVVSFSLWFKTSDPESNYKLASGAWWEGGAGSGWILSTHTLDFWSVDLRSLLMPGLTNVENNFLADEWNHEVVTYDGERIREYTNGRLVNDWPTTGAAIGEGGAMTVGGWPSLPEFNLVGAIDDFRVFSWALTLEEVQDIYKQR
jgi:hypothetical protein